MNDPSIVVQDALRARFIATAAVTELVPAGNILDRNARPAPSPSIVLGEDQVVEPSNQQIDRSLARVISTIHVWKKENALVGVKAIAGAVRRAIGRTNRLTLTDPDFECCDCRITSTRFMRDPDGETSHGIVVVESMVRERWSVTI